MPYLREEDRETIDHALDFAQLSTNNGGELNYVLSRIISQHALDNDISYAVISDVLGAIEGAKFEFLRRVVGPYEDCKICDNGDLEAYDYLASEIGEL